MTSRTILRRFAARLASVWVVSVVACRDESSPLADEQDVDAAAAAAIEEGTPEAVGVLALLNDGNTSFAVLDDDVGLDRRAASSLVAHRDGRDAVFGTADDDLFGTIAEVDATPQVGPATLARLETYALANGWVPEGDDPLGVYDEVPFTVAEAEATLAFVAAATYAQLDVDLGLDARAARGIVDRRPTSMPALAAVPFVGPVAMAALKAAAAPPPPTGTAQEGDPCSTDVRCAAGLICVGLTVDQDAVCSPAWMGGRFTSNPGAQIPDGDLEGVSDAIEVTGLASVPVDVVLELDVDHASRGDLIVRLIGPSTSEETIWNRDAAASSPIVVGPGIERDAGVNGTWTLVVVDAETGVAGSLRGWTLDLTSRWD